MTSNVSERLREFAEDQVWLHDNLGRLLPQYSHQWVAVKGKCVVDSDPDFHALISRLPDAPHTCVGFVTEEPLETIL